MTTKASTDSPKLECPRCQSMRSVVINRRLTQRSSDAFARLRECKDCHTRWQTEERIVRVLPTNHAISSSVSP